MEEKRKTKEKIDMTEYRILFSLVDDHVQQTMEKSYFNPMSEAKLQRFEMLVNLRSKLAPMAGYSWDKNGIKVKRLRSE